MYNDFKIWFKEAHTERKVPTRSEFKDNIEEKIGKLKSNCWKNVIFLQEKFSFILKQNRKLLFKETSLSKISKLLTTREKQWLTHEIERFFKD